MDVGEKGRGAKIKTPILIKDWGFFNCRPALA